MGRPMIPRPMNPTDCAITTSRGKGGQQAFDPQGWSNTGLQGESSQNRRELRQFLRWGAATGRSARSRRRLRSGLRRHGQPVDRRMEDLSDRARSIRHDEQIELDALPALLLRQAVHTAPGGERLPDPGAAEMVDPAPGVDPRTEADVARQGAVALLEQETGMSERRGPA